MSSTAWIVIAAVVILDLLIVPLIVRAAIRGGWKKIHDTHPGVDIAPGTVRKDFQSFKIGMMNLGMSIHVACDDTHLHMLPCLFLRLCTAKPISVPWDAIEIKKRGKWSTHTKIAGADVWGPNWCFDLVDPERSQET